MPFQPTQVGDYFRCTEVLRTGVRVPTGPLLKRRRRRRREAPPTTPVVAGPPPVVIVFPGGDPVTPNRFGDPLIQC